MPRRERGILELTESVAQTFCDFQQRLPGDLEAGGVLLGRMIRDSMDIVVDEATVPTPEDVRTRFSFRRARAPAQMMVSRAWEESDGTRIYLGEWHTHAEPNPSASVIDLSDWSRILKTTTYEHEALFFIIVGTAEIAVWEGQRMRPPREIGREELRRG